MALTKRTQVLLDPEQYRQLKEEAKARSTSVGELVRRALKQTFLQSEQEKRLQALERILAMELPVSSWEQMEKEIEEGYLGCDTSSTPT